MEEDIYCKECANQKVQCLCGGMKQWAEDESEAPQVKDLLKRIKELEEIAKEVYYWETTPDDMKEQIKKLTNIE